MKSAKERAYRYDLYVVPHWRETFDEMILEHVDIPPTGNILHVNCGTGGLAIELATKGGEHGDLIAIDAEAERLKLARAKASVKKLKNISFLEKSPSDLEFEGIAFDLVVADATLMRPEQIEALLAEIAPLAEDEATVAMTMLTHGSFGEVFSLLWEALYHCQLTDRAHYVETLINQYLTSSQAEDMLRRQGLRRVQNFTERRELNFDSGREFLQSPLIEDYFLDHWLDFLPDSSTRQRVLDHMVEIVNREQGSSYFEISVKASLLVGRKEIRQSV